MKVWIPHIDKKDFLTVNLYAQAVKKAGASVALFKMRNIFKIKRKHIVHLHWIASYYKSNFVLKMYIKVIFLILVFLFLKIKGAKIVWTLHNLYPHDCRKPFHQKIIRRLLMSMFSRIFVFGPATRKILQTDFHVQQKKIAVVRRGSHKGFYKEKIAFDFNQRFKFKHKAKLFLCFGKIRPYKGIENLISAFNNTDYNLLVSGKNSDPAYAARLKTLVKTQNIILDIRYIPPEEIFTLFCNAYAVILPYKNITFSGVMMLALAYNKLVITVDKGDLSYYIKNGYNGILLKDNSIEEIKRGIKAVQAINTDKLTKYNNTLNKKLDWDVIGRQLLKEYQSIL